MSCVNLSDFKVPIEERFQFWNQLREILDTARIKITEHMESAPNPIKTDVKDQSAIKETVLHLHQCMIQATDRYIDALRNLERMEESSLTAKA